MWNPFANMAGAAGRTVTIVRGQAATVYDESGRSYLDAIASLWYCNVGHGRTELADAAAVQMHEIAAYQAFEVFSSWRSGSQAWRQSAMPRSSSPLAAARTLLTPRPS
jgi:adenosylmethionine-8-amino-7-oxononanoate aminotransferase